MPTGIKLRPIYYANDLVDILHEMIDMLRVYRPASELDLKSKSLCYHRNGSLDISENPCSDSLYDCQLDFLLYKENEFMESIGAIIPRWRLNYDKILEFASQLVSESEYDNDLVDRYFIPTWQRTLFRQCANDLTDDRVGLRIAKETWIKRYSEIKGLVSNVCWNITGDLNWSLIYVAVLKDRILSEVFGLEDYLPLRERWWKNKCLHVFEGLIERGGYESLSEKRKLLYSDAKYHLKKLIDEPDLFTESLLEDLALFVVAIHEFFLFWSY